MLHARMYSLGGVCSILGLGPGRLQGAFSNYALLALPAVPDDTDSFQLPLARPWVSFPKLFSELYVGNAA